MDPDVTPFARTPFTSSSLLSSGRAVLKQAFVAIVLFAAAVHCVQCIFSDNVSLLDLQSYAHGQEKMPFQGRVAMMPVLRWGHDHYRALVASFPPGGKWGAEPPSAEKMVSFKAALYSMAVLMLLWIRHGVRAARPIWWLCPALGVLSFYVSYAARSEQNWWYPYDLPHAALFTAACLFLLEGRWLWMSVFFLADVPMRETSLYVIPCLLAVGWVEKKVSKALLYASVLTAVWLVVHIAILRRFQANPRDIYIHRFHFYQMLHFHNYWPQVMSVLGFLWLPLALMRRSFSRREVAFVAGAMPGVLTTAALGIWFETRAWSEWNGVAACLLFSALVRYGQHCLEAARDEAVQTLSLGAPR